MSQLAQRLAARLDGLTEGGVHELLAAAFAAAEARWPELAAFDDDAVEQALVSRLEGESDPAAALARLALPDIFLVAQVLLGDRAALLVFDQTAREASEVAMRKLGASAPPVEEVVQELLTKLLVGPAPKVSGFSGHGSLYAWLQVAAVRTAITMTRRIRETPIDDTALAAVADGDDDQALAFLKTKFRAEFKAAFAAAVGELEPRPRILLRLQIIDQLTLEDIGAFYDVSRATAARWLADARYTLVELTQRRLLDTLAIDATELSELMRLVATNLYATLPGLLR